MREIYSVQVELAALTTMAARYIAEETAKLFHSRVACINKQQIRACFVGLLRETTPDIVQ